jgi:hypothetical protein
VTKFDQLLQQITERESDLQVIAKGDMRSLEIVFPNERRQRVAVEHQGERYVLTSVVLKSRQVEEIGRTEVLIRLWQRNRETSVVAFSLDKWGQLVGQIEQLAETIDSEELVFYLKLLARECDQFEYVLAGQDQQ